VVTRRLQAERRTGSVRRPQTSVLQSVLRNQHNVFQSDRERQQTVSGLAFPARRGTGDGGDSQSSTTPDIRRPLRREMIDHGTGGGGGGGGEERSSAARPRRRRRSMYARRPPRTAEDETNWPTSRVNKSRTLATGDDSKMLRDELRLSAARPPLRSRPSAARPPPRRSSCTSFTLEHPSPTLSPVCVTDKDNATSTLSPFRLKLQTKVKVSERPVRCLVNARYDLLRCTAVM